VAPPCPTTPRWRPGGVGARLCVTTRRAVRRSTAFMDAASKWAADLHAGVRFGQRKFGNRSPLMTLSIYA
jgi:hypothetical protein